MNPQYEKKIRQALAKAIAKETVKSAAQVAEFPDSADKKQLEKLIQMEAEKILAPSSPTSSPPDTTVISYVFRAPPQDGPVHFKLSGMEKAFRDSLDGVKVSESVRSNLSISIEFVRRF